MPNTIDELRTHLFATLKALGDKDKPMEIERAKAIANIAQTLINTAKVEVDYMRVSGSIGTGFIQDTTKKLTGPKNDT
jgi:hypothetical protein